MEVAVQVGLTGRGGVEPVPDPEREPGPGARFVAGQEDRVGAGRRLRGDMADGPLKAADVVGRNRLAAGPADHAQVMLAQPVAQRRLGRGHVDQLAREQVTDPGGPDGAPVPQPVLPLPRVNGDDLLGGLVDVPGHDLGQVHRDGGEHPGVVVRLPGQLTEDPVEEDRVPEPVGPQQRGQRGAALRPSARLLQGGGRGVHVGQVDLVLHDLQARADVAVDARGEQRQHRLVVAQLGDLSPGYRVHVR